MDSSATLRVAQSQVLGTALNLIRTRHEDRPIPHRLFFHVRGHTEGVVDRVVKIAQAFGLSERETLLAVIAAAFHDTVQHWSYGPGPNNTVIRARLGGMNEISSTLEAVAMMSELDPDINFTAFEVGVVAQAIHVTIPDWNRDLGTTIQPFLTSRSHPVARAVALADLGEAGMDPEAFVRTGPLLFAEDQLDIMQSLSEANRSSDISLEMQEQFRARFIFWLARQPSFAGGRRAMLGNELEGLPPEAKLRTKELFCRFDDSMTMARTATGLAETMEFVPLMRTLLPEAFPLEAL